MKYKCTDLIACETYKFYQQNIYIFGGKENQKCLSYNPSKYTKKRVDHNLKMKIKESVKFALLNVEARLIRYES